MKIYTKQELEAFRQQDAARQKKLNAARWIWMVAVGVPTLVYTVFFATGRISRALGLTAFLVSLILVNLVYASKVDGAKTPFFKQFSDAITVYKKQKIDKDSRQLYDSLMAVEGEPRNLTLLVSWHVNVAAALNNLGRSDEAQEIIDLVEPFAEGKEITRSVKNMRTILENEKCNTIEVPD